MERAELTGWGDAGALVNFSGRARQTLSNLQSVTLNAVSGEIVHQADAREHGPFYRIFAAVTPLHYVMFGDELLKLFYPHQAFRLEAASSLLEEHAIHEHGNHGGDWENEGPSQEDKSSQPPMHRRSSLYYSNMRWRC